jgi:hypothetical protein
MLIVGFSVFHSVSYRLTFGEIVPSDATKVNYKLPGFFSKFFELQRVMWTTNAGLTDRHAFDSRPDSWPRLKRGIVSPYYSRLICHCLPIRSLISLSELLGERS